MRVFCNNCDKKVDSEDDLHQDNDIYQGKVCTHCAVDYLKEDYDGRIKSLMKAVFLLAKVVDLDKLNLEEINNIKGILSDFDYTVKEEK